VVRALQLTPAECAHLFQIAEDESMDVPPALLRAGNVDRL